MHYSGEKITTQYSTILASIFVFFFFPCVSPSVSKFGEQQSAHLFVYANTPFLTHVSEQAKAGADVPLFREPGPFLAITPSLNGVLRLRYKMPSQPASRIPGGAHALQLRS